RYRQLVLAPDQDQVAVLAEVGIDAELVLEALIRDDAVRGQLDTQAVGVLVANAAARKRRRAGADGVALEHDHRAHAEPGQMVRRAHAHDPGADARLAAEAADKAIRSGHRIGPLHGVPIALKDLVDLQGRVTTGGSKVWAERVSPVTATLAQRLIAAGMIVLGKTHTVEFAMG